MDASSTVDICRTAVKRGTERRACELQQLATEIAAAQLARAAHGDQPSGIDERDAIAVFRLIHVVGRDEDRDAFGRQVVDQVPEAAARLGSTPDVGSSRKSTGGR